MVRDPTDSRKNPVCIIDVPQERRLDGIVVLGFRIADDPSQMQRIREAVLAVQRELGELGFKFVITLFRADVHVVEHAVDQRVVSLIDAVRRRPQSCSR